MVWYGIVASVAVSAIFQFGQTHRSATTLGRHTGLPLRFTLLPKRPSPVSAQSGNCR